MEYAVANGYLMATVKDYARKRERGRHEHVQHQSQDWVAGLMALSGARGAGGRQTASGDSPVNGLTAEAFRADIAAMRAAEYERARERKAGPH